MHATVARPSLPRVHWTAAICAVPGATYANCTASPALPHSVAVAEVAPVEAELPRHQRNVVIHKHIMQAPYRTLNSYGHC